MEDRPPPAPDKLLRQFRDWQEGTELPGRTVSYLKTGFLPEVLAELEEAKGVPAMLDVWEQWELGSIHPEQVLIVLDEKGIVELLEAATAEMTPG